MNRTLKVFDSLWSLACIATTCCLFGLFIYWVFLQEPFLSVSAGGYQTEYSAPSGSVLFIENPVTPPTNISQMTVTAELHGENYQYALAPPADGRVAYSLSSDNATSPYPVYALYIPTYVVPGVYEYRAVLEYKLNPFRRFQLELPVVKINVL